MQKFWWYFRWYFLLICYIYFLDFIIILVISKLSKINDKCFQQIIFSSFICFHNFIILFIKILSFNPFEKCNLSYQQILIDCNFISLINIYTLGADGPSGMTDGCSPDPEGPALFALPSHLTARKWLEFTSTTPVS